MVHDGRKEGLKQEIAACERDLKYYGELMENAKDEEQKKYAEREYEKARQQHNEARTEAMNIYGPPFFNE